MLYASHAFWTQFWHTQKVRAVGGRVVISCGVAEGVTLAALSVMMEVAGVVDAVGWGNGTCWKVSPRRFVGS